MRRVEASVARDGEDPMTDVRSARTGGADYRPMTENTLAPYLAGFSDVSAILGGAAQDWKVTEVGDGNLNLVFIVRGPKGSLIVNSSQGGGSKDTWVLAENKRGPHYGNGSLQTQSQTRGDVQPC